jgi:type IV secretion system protein VirD4
MAHPFGKQFGIPYGYEETTQSFPTYYDNRHLCSIGPTRSGKGATIIMQALLRVQHSVVMVDPKGQNAAVTAWHRRALGQEVFVLNPFGLHEGSPWKLPRHRYNPLAAYSIDNPNIVADIAALSQALIVTQGREPYFDDTARDLVSAIMLFLIATLGKKATLGHMRKILTDIGSRNKEGAEHIVAMAKSPHRFIANPIGRFTDIEARDISSAINTAITQTAFLDDPALTDPARGTLTGSDFEFPQLKQKPTTVYLILPGRYMDAYSRFLRLMITSAIDQCTASAGGHPVLMILDEFARLQNLPAVASAFGFAAGFNLQLWPFLQDLAQLENIYRKEWPSILGNCGMTQFFTPADMQTSEYIQRRGGMRTGQSRSRTYSGIWKAAQSESQSDSRMALLPIEETMSLRQDKSIVFFAGTHAPFLTGRTPYWRIPQLVGRFEKDPYHSD